MLNRLSYPGDTRYGMDIIAPFYSKENWGIERLRSTPLWGIRDKLKSQRHIKVSLAPEPMPLPHTGCQPCPLGFLSSLHRTALPPHLPTKSLQIRSLLHSFQMLSLQWGRGAWVKDHPAICHWNVYPENTLTWQVPGYRVWTVTSSAGMRRPPSPDSPSVLPSQHFSPGAVLHRLAPFQLGKGFYCNWKQTPKKCLLYRGI